MITWRPAGLLALALLTLPLWPAPWLALAGYIVVVLLVAGIDVLAATPLSRVRLGRDGVRQLRLGDSGAVWLTVTNAGLSDLRAELRDVWPPSAGASRGKFVFTLGPGEHLTCENTLQPTRRGDRLAEQVVVRSYGPLRFGYRQSRKLAAPWTVRVLPPFTSRKFLPERLARLRVFDGSVVTKGRGQGTEFDALREYVVGDDVRSIDWRGTARRETVVVRTWRPERDRRVLCVLDTGRTSAARVGDAPRLDSALDAALLLSALASRANDRVDFLAVDTAVRAAVEGASQATLMPKIVQAMAPLEPALVETDFGLVVAEVLRRERKRALVVLFTALEPGALGEGLLPILNRLTAKHTVILAAVHDPEVEQLAAQRSTVPDIYTAAAAERTLTERRRVAAVLRKHGVHVVDAPADQYAPAVADLYLHLKATGRL
ncbi:DUF58 domain-containing protein [Longispora albida]|uniref:DUF58 domain-containing protein n=1 Tax=Longispora albida TaxID=203523 RepID=UPI00036C9B1A|nr:DUF58 domain-containing protein [Longispora albida]